MTCEQCRELLELHVLGALSKSEQRLVDAHLASCAECRSLCEGHARTAALLTDAVASTSAQRTPARVWSNLEAATSRKWRSSEFPGVRSLARVGPSWQLIGASVLLLLCGLSLFWGMRQSSALARERNLRSELERVVDERELIMELVDSNRTTKAMLRATQPGSTSYGKLYTRPDMPHVVVLVGRLPPLPEGHVYRLWLQSSGKIEAAGTIKLSDDGFGLLLFDSGRNGPNYESAQVIPEPESTAYPSGAPVIRWEAVR